MFANYDETVVKSRRWSLPRSCTYKIIFLFSVVDCGNLESPDNGTVDLSEGTTFGSTAFYSCDEIFELVGNSTRVCLSSGVWSNESPVCNSE